VPHWILLREVGIDAPSETFAATRDFWAAALLTEARHGACSGARPLAGHADGLCPRA
jgi:hypothetical protein